MSPIFINFRRTKTRDKALILRIILDKEFGEGVSFLDEASIAPGSSWAKELKTSVEKCHVLLALIHTDWHKDQDLETGDKCLSRDQDWIRQEIATALKSNKKVIPLLIDGAYLSPSGVDAQRTNPPKNEWLPDELHPLFEQQAFRLRFDDLTPQNLGDLLTHIKTHLPEPWNTTEAIEHQEQGGYYPGILQKEFPLPDDLADAQPTSLTPYVGLRPFRREDARLFYGRSREIYDLCFKLIHEDSRLLLLDGYSGTGKSSLLQAGLIPRMEAQGWNFRYSRREEDKFKGLPGLLANARKELGGFDGKKLVILDQVEEVLTNPILTLPREIPDLLFALDNAFKADPRLKVILGFRSEFTTHLKHQLDEHLDHRSYDLNNTIFSLERHGVVEAIRSVTAEPSLNGDGKHFDLRFSPMKTLPETIADRLISSNLGYHIAPLLQVNMELLWQRCRRDDGAVEITGAAVTNFIDTHEALLEHYLGKIRQQITSEQVDDQRLLELLQYYVEEKPASAVRSDRDFAREFASDSFAHVMRDACKQLYLLYSQGSGETAITRLSHDSLAQVIHGRYSGLTKLKVTTYGTSFFEYLKKQLETQINTLQYHEARNTLDQMMTVEEQRQKLYPYFFELAYFWNEVQTKEAEPVLKHWMNSGLLSGDQNEQLSMLLSNIPRREGVRQWLSNVDPGRYRDMQTRYLAPQQTVMVPIDGGEFIMGDETGDLGEDARPKHPVRVSSFWVGNAPVTRWQYGLYLFSVGRAKELQQANSSRGSMYKGNHPASELDWYDAVSYCNWLSNQMGLTPAYLIATEENDPNNDAEDDDKKWTVRRIEGSTGFRLPTEAEWEYACRAGTTTKFSFGDDEGELGDYGWFNKNSDGNAHPVCLKKPNAWGLHDMHGNVLEWCQDWYGEYSSHADVDPVGTKKGAYRAVRGGTWDDQAQSCRAAYRFNSRPSIDWDYVGFRLFASPFQAVVGSETGASR